jgi:hypothetical protein
MATPLIRLRAVLLFYRSVAPFMLGITALLIGVVQLPGLHEGWAKNALLTLLSIKLLTTPAVWYLAEQMRPNQYWLYFNLGLTRSFLWGSVAVLDGVLFLAPVAGLNALYA